MHFLSCCKYKKKKKKEYVNTKIEKNFKNRMTNFSKILQKMIY